MKKLLETIKKNPNAKALNKHIRNLPNDFVQSKGGKDKVTQKDFYDFWKGRVAAKQGELQVAQIDLAINKAENWLKGK